MANTEVELNPIDFITVGTVGPKGKRMFHLQAGRQSQIVTLTMEKEQCKALGEAIKELLDDLQKRFPEGYEGDVNLNSMNMELRDPVEPLFRIAQIGLGFDETTQRIVIVAQELVPLDDDQDPDLVNPGVARFWGTREQFRALSLRAGQLVTQGRVDPKSNGRLIYYWT